jgi:hypothetical protein
MADTARTPPAWTLEVAYDDAVQIDSEPEGPAGAARLEFEDGSFIEVDPTDLARVLRICAMQTPTGWWLLRVAIGAEIAEAAESDELPECGRLTPGAPPHELAILTRAALIDHLGTYDRPSRRPIWRVELLATLAAIQVVDDGQRRWTLVDEPLGIAPLEAADAGASLVTRLSEASAANFQELSSSAGKISLALGDTQAAARFQTVATSSRFLADVGAAIGVLEAQLESSDGTDNTAADSWMASEEEEEEEDEAAYLAPTETIELNCDIDVREVRTFELAPESHVTLSVAGGVLTINVDHVRMVVAGQLFLRVFDPEPMDATSAKLLCLVPVQFDAATGTLSARVELTAASLARVSGPILGEFVESADPTEFPSRYQYWARIGRSNFARLILAVVEQSDHITSAIRVRHDAAVRALLEADGTRGEAAARKAARRISDGAVSGSLQFITPALLPDPS